MIMRVTLNMIAQLDVSVCSGLLVTRSECGAFSSAADSRRFLATWGFVAGASVAWLAGSGSRLGTGFCIPVPTLYFIVNAAGPGDRLNLSVPFTTERDCSTVGWLATGFLESAVA